MTNGTESQTTLSLILVYSVSSVDPDTRNIFSLEASSLASLQAAEKMSAALEG